MRTESEPISSSCVCSASSISQDKTLYFIGLFNVNVVIPVELTSFRNNISLASVLVVVDVEALDFAMFGSSGDADAATKSDNIRGGNNDEVDSSRCIMVIPYTNQPTTAAGGGHDPCTMDMEKDGAGAGAVEVMTRPQSDGQTNGIIFIQFVCLSLNLVFVREFVCLSSTNVVRVILTDRRMEYILLNSSVCLSSIVANSY